MKALFFGSVLFCSEKLSHSHKRTMCFQNKNNTTKQNKQTNNPQTHQTTKFLLISFIFFLLSQEIKWWVAEWTCLQDDQKEFWGFWEVKMLSRFGVGLSHNKTMHHRLPPPLLISHKPKIKKKLLCSLRWNTPWVLPEGWCFWKFHVYLVQQTLKDFIELLSILIACCTNTSKPPFSTGSSDHAHIGPCQGSHGTLELFMLLAPQDFVDSATLSQERVFCKTTAFLGEAEKQSCSAAVPWISKALSAAHGSATLPCALRPGCLCSGQLCCSPAW